MKKIMLSMAVGISLFAGEFKFDGDNIGKVSRITCDDGQQGFEIVITNPSVNKKVSFNSCSVYNGVAYNGEIKVSGIDESGGPETRVIDGTSYYFPNGYTEPTKESEGTGCDGVFAGYWGTNLFCRGEVTEGFLNVNYALNNLQFDNNNVMSNVDNMANMTSVNSVQFSNVTSLENLDGMKNLQEVRYGMYIRNSPKLTDISGLSNVNDVKFSLILDNKDYEGKLDSDSYLCNEGFSKISFYDNPESGSSATRATEADKSKICK